MLSRIIKIAIFFSIAINITPIKTIAVTSYCCSEKKTYRIKTEQDTIIADYYFNIADSLSHFGQYDSAIFYLEKANIIYQYENKWNKYIRCLNNLCRDYNFSGNFVKALECSNLAIKVGLEKLGDNNIEVITAHDYKGFTYDNLGDYDKALELYLVSLAKKQLILPDKNHPSIAASYQNMGVAYANMGDAHKAMQYQTKALSLKILEKGENHHDVASSYINISVLHTKNGDYETGLQYCKRALNIYIDLLGYNHPEVASAYFGIGAIYNFISNYEKALEYYDISLDIRMHTLPPNHPDLASCYFNKGIIYKVMENYDSSLYYHKKSLEIDVYNFGETHFYTVWDLVFIASVYSEQGNYKAAQELFDKCYPVLLEHNKGGNPLLATFYKFIARNSIKQGNFSEALFYHQKNLLILVNGFKDEDVYKNPVLKKVHTPGEPSKIEGVNNPILLLKILVSKGDVFYQIYDS